MVRPPTWEREQQSGESRRRDARPRVRDRRPSRTALIVRGRRRGPRIVGDAELWEDSVSCWAPRSLATAASCSRGTISTASDPLPNAGASAGRGAEVEQDPTPVKEPETREEDDLFATPPAVKARTSARSSSPQEGRYAGGLAEEQNPLGRPEQPENSGNVTTIQKATRERPEGESQNLILAAVCREHWSPQISNRGIRSRFHPQHREWKRSVGELVRAGVLQPLPETPHTAGERQPVRVRTSLQRDGPSPQGSGSDPEGATQLPGPELAVEHQQVAADQNGPAEGQEGESEPPVELDCDAISSERTWESGMWTIATRDKCSGVVISIGQEH